MFRQSKQPRPTSGHAKELLLVGTLVLHQWLQLIWLLLCCNCLEFELELSKSSYKNKHEAKCIREREWLVLYKSKKVHIRTKTQIMSH